MGPHNLFVFSCFSRVWLFVTPWTVAYQASLSIGFSRQEYWSRLPCPIPGDLPNPGIKPTSPASPALQADSLPLNYCGSPTTSLWNSYYYDAHLTGKKLSLGEVSSHIQDQIRKEASGPKVNMRHRSNLLKVTQLEFKARPLDLSQGSGVPSSSKIPWISFSVYKSQEISFPWKRGHSCTFLLLFQGYNGNKDNNSASVSFCPVWTGKK